MKFLLNVIRADNRIQPDSYNSTLHWKKKKKVSKDSGAIVPFVQFCLLGVP